MEFFLFFFPEIPPESLPHLCLGNRGNDSLRFSFFPLPPHVPSSGEKRKWRGSEIGVGTTSRGRTDLILVSRIFPPDFHSIFLSFPPRGPEKIADGRGCVGPYFSPTETRNIHFRCPDLRAGLGVGFVFPPAPISLEAAQERGDVPSPESSLLATDESVARR